MLELKDYQKEAVRKLKENIVDMLGWRNLGVGSPDHIQESDISMLYYLSHSHFT